MKTKFKCQFKISFLTSLFFLGTLLMSVDVKSQQNMGIFYEGVAGHTTGQMLSRINSSVFAHNPTTTIVLGGTNDFTNVNKLTSLSVFESNLRSIVDQIIADGGELIIMTMPPVIESIFLEGKDESLWAPDGPNSKIIEGNTVIRQIATEKNIVLVDLYVLFNNNQNLISNDGLHQTEAGSQEMANLLYDVFVNEGYSTANIVCFGDSITKRYPSFLYDTLLPFTGPQTVGNTFTVGNFNYKVTSSYPNEIELTGSTATGNFSIPVSATDSGTSTTYNLTEIGKNAFLSNASIGDVVVPEGVITLGENAFNSSSVTSIMLPNSLTTIVFRAFRGASNLTTLTIPNSVTTIGDQVWHSSGLTDIVFSNSVTSVGTHTFYLSGNLVTATLGSSMPAITNRMFYNTKVAELTLPASITTFDEGSWTGSKITKLIVLGTTPATINTAWAGNASSITAYVPTASVAAYKAAPIWKDMIILDKASLSIQSIEALNVSIYPNPTSGNVFVKTKQQNAVDLTVIDLNGRNLLSVKGNQVDMSNLSEGIYILKGKTEKGTFAQRIVKR